MCSFRRLWLTNVSSGEETSLTKVGGGIAQVQDTIFLLGVFCSRLIISTKYAAKHQLFFSIPQRFIPIWPRCTLAVGFDIPGFIVCQVLISHCLMWQSTNKLLTPQMNTFSTKGTRHMEDIFMQIVLMVKYGYLNRYKWCILNRFSPLRHKAGATIMTDYVKTRSWVQGNDIS